MPPPDDTPCAVRACQASPKGREPSMCRCVRAACGRSFGDPRGSAQHGPSGPGGQQDRH